MKLITKEIREEVKKLIKEVGGTDNILNLHKNNIFYKYTTEKDRKNHSDRYYEVLNTIDNQINYYRFGKKM